MKLFCHFILFIIFLLILPSVVISQTQTKEFSSEEYLKKQVNEQVYVHTDRDVYQPGDTIWFNAYVRNSLSLQKSELSQLFYVFLVYKDSIIMQWEKYLITDSQSKGYFAIKNNETEGAYYLVAFSSWMNNFNPECFFRKKIMIRNTFGKNQKYTPFFSKSTYYPGDTLRIRMEYLNRLKRDENDKNLEYLIKKGKKIAYKVKPFKTETPDALDWILSATDTLPYKFEVSNNDDFKKTVEIPVARQINIDFYPEGGNCVSELMNNVAFKATYDNGSSAEIAGDIINEKGDVLFRTKTEHGGMGKFIYLPRKGEKYYFKINSPKQLNGTYEIPSADDAGWTLAARASPKTIVTEIRNNFSHADTCYLTLSIHGVFYSYKKIPVTSQAITTISTSTFPRGIGVLTLLNNAHRPIAERLVFVNYDRSIEAHLVPNKERSLRLDSMVLNIKVNGKYQSLTKGQYSLSVYDDQIGSTIEVNEANIIASTYFSDELKGNIIDPNYYFNPQNTLAIKHLDLLLMVQGWRKYKYVNFLNNYTLKDYPISQDLICGILRKHKFGKGLVTTPGKLNIYFAGNSKMLDVEEDGEFCFYPDYEENKGAFIMISGEDRKGNSKVNISTNTNRFYANLKAYLNENPLDKYSPNEFIYTHDFVDDQFKMNLDNTIWIDEVEVHQTKDTLDFDQHLVRSLFDYKAASNEYLKTSVSVLELIRNLGYNAEESEDGNSLLVYYQGEFVTMGFYVDGMLYDYDLIDQLRPDDFEYFYIAKGFDVKNIYGSLIVAIMKFENATNVYQKDNGVLNPITIQGPQVCKEFYSPTYTQLEKTEPVLDARKTIYWNSNITLNEHGEATVSFYNANRIAAIKCVLQGITDEGIPVYGETFYKVVHERDVP